MLSTSVRDVATLRKAARVRETLEMLQQKERWQVLHTSDRNVATIRKAVGAAQIGERLQQ